eukprot:CAMPEP_0183739874 /NCGR_PEP_ID=MMETSP0737-20130205/58257_1 /TAXON_ID=385413 /ORGANISM="Thalassiosira miniscula, Strain CCMP1093" /LENGTH=43 /DNA_ID= /DNA_START= /DNA_END= /DNA_ORIENTATION=
MSSSIRKPKKAMTSLPQNFNKGHQTHTMSSNNNNNNDNGYDGG